MLTNILIAVEARIATWQHQLPDCSVVLGGSLVSGLFVLEGASVIDADVRFLVPEPSRALADHIASVTGLAYRKEIPVADWHGVGQKETMSIGYMVEGVVDLGLPLPVEVEGCVRNPSYVGWAKYYPLVLTQEELAQFRADKVRLRDDKAAYKALKQAMLAIVRERAIERGLVR